MNNSSEAVLIFTERGAAQLKQVEHARGAPVVLRVRVTGGGCAGFQYVLSLEDPKVMEKNSEDICITQAGVSAVTDKRSLAYIQDSTIDYQETLMMSQFVILNPNSDGQCSCGAHFK